MLAVVEEEEEEEEEEPTTLTCKNVLLPENPCNGDGCGDDDCGDIEDDDGHNEEDYQNDRRKHCANAAAFFRYNFHCYTGCYIHFGHDSGTCSCYSWPPFSKPTKGLCSAMSSGASTFLFLAEVTMMIIIMIVTMTMRMRMMNPEP